jgi:hypothetical protein
MPLTVYRKRPPSLLSVVGIRNIILGILYWEVMITKTIAEKIYDNTIVLTFNTLHSFLTLFDDELEEEDPRVYNSLQKLGLIPTPMHTHTAPQLNSLSSTPTADSTALKAQVAELSLELSAIKEFFFRER